MYEVVLRNIGFYQRRIYYNKICLSVVIYALNWRKLSVLYVYFIQSLIQTTTLFDIQLFQSVSSAKNYPMLKLNI